MLSSQFHLSLFVSSCFRCCCPRIELRTLASPFSHNAAVSACFSAPHPDSTDGTPRLHSPAHCGVATTGPDPDAPDSALRLHVTAPGPLDAGPPDLGGPPRTDPRELLRPSHGVPFSHGQIFSHPHPSAPPWRASLFVDRPERREKYTAHESTFPA